MDPPAAGSFVAFHALVRIWVCHTRFTVPVPEHRSQGTFPQDFPSDKDMQCPQSYGRPLPLHTGQCTVPLPRQVGHALVGLSLFLPIATRDLSLISLCERLSCPPKADLLERLVRASQRDDRTTKRVAADQLGRWFLSHIVGNDQTFTVSTELP
jgi:hypothetical protein